MRISLFLIAILILPFSWAVQTGYCTGQYVEMGDSWESGLIQEGDVFEYWCELPEAVPEDTGFTIELRYPNAELIQHVLVPRPVYGTSVVVFP